ncbi:MAG: hypothetical protein M1457_14125, partial [bacterium]|nr:hypothetical protein [bacterium]
MKEETTNSRRPATGFRRIRWGLSALFLALMVWGLTGCAIVIYGAAAHGSRRQRQQNQREDPAHTPQSRNR